MNMYIFQIEFKNGRNTVSDIEVQFPTLHFSYNFMVLLHQEQQLTIYQTHLQVDSSNIPLHERTTINEELLTM